MRWVLAPACVAAMLALSSTARATPICPAQNGGVPATPYGDLKYYGGHVISNVKVIEVAWGSNVDTTYMTKLSAFYTAIVASPYIDWLSEYDTIGLVGFADLKPGSEQHIGRGSFGGSFTITPANTATTLTDSDIATELVHQLTTNALPAPSLDKDGNVDSLYMIDFPPGITITMVNITSCSSFGAYHSTATYQGKSVPYGVHPSCGYSFDTATVIHSHELVEAITDTEVGIVETNTTAPSARPLAWVTLAPTAWASLEIADICEGSNATVATYAVQKVWSNYAQACVAEIPICDGSLVPPACRPCNVFDDDVACSGQNPACATSGPKQGTCVHCTSKDTSACAAPTPACDDATYTCVACATSSDCKTVAAPVCDASSHTCRGCQKDSECTQGVCDLASDTSQGQCVACNVDGDCKSGEQCTAHSCAPKQLDAGADGSTNPPGGGGCSCTLSSPASRAGGWASLVVVALLFTRRRRTRG